MFRYQQKLLLTENTARWIRQEPAPPLFLNIETTGLRPQNSFLYLTGMAWYEDSNMQSLCLLAESRREEETLLRQCLAMAGRWGKVFTIGGSTFTRRYLAKRARNYVSGVEELSAWFSGIQMEDIQHELLPYRDRLSLPNMKKESLEAFLGLTRRESITGKEMIDLYESWERNRDNSSRGRILAHHLDDLRSLTALFSLRSYLQFFRGQFGQDLQSSRSGDELIVSFSLLSPVPVPVSFTVCGTSAELSEQKARFHIPIYRGPLRYFLPGRPADYYYLPQEEMAVHKSVGIYVDKSCRVKATSETCYIKKEGVYLPGDKAPEGLPLFYESGRSGRPWVQLIDEPGWLSSYIRALLA